MRWGGNLFYLCQYRSDSRHAGKAQRVCERVQGGKRLGFRHRPHRKHRPHSIQTWRAQRKAIAQHKNEVLMFNDTTGEWSRDSPFNDLGVLTTADPIHGPRMARAAGPRVESIALETGRRTQRELPGQSLFIKACASCHSLGKAVKVGPGLQGLAQRRDLAWIRAYLTGPDKLRAAKDPTAMDLQRAFPGVRMPNLGIV